MTSRRRAIAFAWLLAAALAAALVVETARGANPPGARAAVSAIRHEFGDGRLAGCMVAIADRETGGTYNPHAVNWTDRHADGSRGSFGVFQIGALWRHPGESVDHFARRMFDARANARLAHRLYRLLGLAPWGGRC